MKPFKCKDTSEDMRYRFGYRDALSNITGLINKWVYEDDLDPLYAIAKLEGYIKGYNDTVNFYIEGV